MPNGSAADTAERLTAPDRRARSAGARSAGAAATSPGRRTLGAFAAAAAMAAWCTVAGPAAQPVAAAQPAPAHRAAVIVDTGTEVRRICVRFAEESLSGVEVLARAGTDPVLRGFAGKGAAVCALCGTGCPGDDSCLTCDPGGRFWSYSRAPAGTAALRTSGVGASGTTVRDGDVEGWRWGTGGTPPFATVAEVCGEAPAPTSTTAAPPPAGTATTVATTAVTTSPSTTAPRARVTTPPTAAAPATAASPPTTAPPPAGTATTAAPTTTAPTTAPPSPRGTPAASREAPGDDGGGPWGLAAFAAAVAGLAGWAAVARRRRRPGG